MVTVRDLTVATRDVPTTSQAAQIGTTSMISVADGSDFDTQDYTLMAWVYPEAVPGTSQSYTVIDVHDQYALAIGTGGKVLCSYYDGTNVVFLSDVETTTTNAWNLVACSHGNGMYCLAVWPNGTGPGTYGCAGDTDTLFTAGQGADVGSSVQGTTVTNPLVGKLDSVRALSRFLAPKDICLQAGFSGC